jgi:hypothetical protein
MLANPDAVTRRVSKFGLREGDGVIGSLLLGIGDFAMATVAFLALLVVVVLGATVRAAPAAPAGPRPSLELLARALVAGLLIVLLTVVATGATTVKDRWLQPVLFFAPVVLVGLMAGRLPPDRLALIVRLAGVAALAVMIALPARVWLAGGGDKVPVENRPYTTFSDQIRAQFGFTTGTIIAGDYATGGNLAINLPDASALIPEYERLAVPTPWPVLLVWSGDDAVPAPIAQTLRLRFGVDPPRATPVILAAPVHHGGGAMDRLRVLRIDEPG